MLTYDRVVGQHDVRLSELDLRCQCLETANYDGLLIWKINDYKERKRQAVEGQVLSLYSQPFYTSRYGYKMCARVYLNGDGAGRNTHLSLFFVVMQVRSCRNLRIGPTLHTVQRLSHTALYINLYSSACDSKQQTENRIYTKYTHKKKTIQEQ